MVGKVSWGRVTLWRLWRLWSFAESAGSKNPRVGFSQQLNYLEPLSPIQMLANHAWNGEKYLELSDIFLATDFHWVMF